MRKFGVAVAVIALATSGAAQACSVFNHDDGDLRVGRNLDWVESSRGRFEFLPWLALRRRR